MGPDPRDMRWWPLWKRLWKLNSRRATLLPAMWPRSMVLNRIPYISN